MVAPVHLVIRAANLSSDGFPTGTGWALGAGGWTTIGQLSGQREKLTATTDRAGRV
ncbi:hypothetical protein ACQP2P_12525 [Dactylosporangium sp. CA-139114]|uniref:hypothetical protein n=1 Tax=Dactylosporangium sp. CA-139114 TaxID=3239931 RepID=UPI003D985757